MSYLNKSIPKSVREVVDNVAQDKVALIVKNALVSYLDNFLNTTGATRQVAEEMASTTLQFISDKSLAQDQDPKNVRQTQLATLTDGLTEKIPCVLVTDTSVEWVPAGIGHLEEESYEDGDPVKGFSFIFSLDIKIFVVTHDEVATKDLANLISLMLGPLQNVAGGSYIKSDNPNSEWVVKLPIIFPAPTVRKELMAGDTTENYWIAEIDVPGVKYENKLLLRLVEEKVKGIDAIVDSPNAYIAPQIMAPPKFIVGQSVIVQVRYLEPNDRIVVINSGQLTTSWEEADKASVRITGARLGAFDVVVINGKGEVKVKQTYQVTLT